jgi:hypothetical protein
MTFKNPYIVEIRYVGKGRSQEPIARDQQNGQSGPPD